MPGHKIINIDRKIGREFFYDNNLYLRGFKGLRIPLFRQEGDESEPFAYVFF